MTRSFTPALFLLCALLVTPVQTLQANLLEQGFEVDYAASYRGLHVGVTTRRLVPNGDDTWTFTSDSEPAGLVKLIVTFDVTEQSRLLIDEQGVRPLSYSYRYGDRGDKSYRLDFDWQAGKVNAQPVEVDLDLPPDTQDNLSFLVAVMQKLQHGIREFDMVVAGRKKLRAHQVEALDEQTQRTEQGELSTVFVKAQEVGRDTRYELWCAPSLDYLPVRMRQVKKGKADIELELRRVTPLGDSTGRTP
jgi:hypothetical protein